MGKIQRKHNWRGRQNQSDAVDVGKKDRKKNETDVSTGAVGNTDDPNAEILPSRKRKLENVYLQPKVRKLSKKERKRLEKVIETKEKKMKRTSVLESLAKLQSVREELKDLKSTADVFSGKKFVQKKDDDFVKKKKKGLIPVVVEEDLAEESSENEDNDSESREGESEMDDDNISLTDTVEKVTVEKEIKEEIPKKNVTLSEPKVKVPAVHVILNRKDEIQQSRLRLPILAEEQLVMETINDNRVTVICGETGSGKTTQVPQFLYEGGYAQRGLIAVTEPRRIAAISMSYRVAEEMNLSSDIVSYQIRYEGNSTEKTKVKFMTDGVLLKAIQQDFLLSNYSVVILDEAHERSAFTDILIGLLSRIVPLREKRGNPLKLIIMSATLRIEDFTENRLLFREIPPVVKVESRQYPVTIHFNKITPDNYLDEVFRKVSKIHKMLPDGGILVFLTSQQEIHALCRRLTRTYPSKYTETNESESKSTKIDLDKYSIMPVDDTEVDQNDEENEGKVEAEMSDSDENEAVSSASPLHVLPLFSLLSSARQKKVFDPPPEGCRLCIIATNVAETSLTIPNIKYVVDCGKVKTKFFDKVTGVSTFKVTWVSKASADQRSGRAGRVGPGHSYRLYSSAVFNDFEQFSQPEIVRRPVDDLILQMKELHIEKVSNFPFPTPPAYEAILAGEEALIGFRALEIVPNARGKKEKFRRTRITSLGKTMACFPVLPCYGKMLALAHQNNLLYYAITIVSALSVQQVFLESDDGANLTAMKESHAKLMQTKLNLAGVGNSQLLGDLMVLLKIVGAFDFEGGTGEFCNQWGVRQKAMNEIRKLRQQLTNTVNSVFSNTNLVMDPKYPPPTDAQARLLRQIVLAGAGNRVARRSAEPTGTVEERRKMKNAYKNMTTDDLVFIHPKSVLYKKTPEFVIYQELQESSKMYMKGVSAIESEWLPVFAPQFAQLSKPFEDPPPRFDGENVLCHRSSTYGPWTWEIPAVEVPYPECLNRYRWFAFFFMNGEVFKKLAEFVPILLSKPQTMTKSWAKLQPRTESLLTALASRGCDKKSVLAAIWEKEQQFLLIEYLEWIPSATHSLVEAKWPPL